MALANFFLILILLPSFQALSNATSDNIQNLPTQNLITLACTSIENQDLCHSNLQLALENQGPATPNSILKAALRVSLNEARQAIESMTKFNTLSISYREQLAIEDCKELLDFSVSELAWSLNEMKRIRAGDKNVHYEGNLKAWLSAALSNQDTCLEGFEGYREQLAIEDCKELLDFSVSELAWSLNEMKRIRAGDKNVHYEGNLKAWLSAALSNQDTCLEGFEGTDRRLEHFVKGSLQQVTQLITNVLGMYTQLHSLPFRTPRNNTAQNESSKFPKWMTDGDKEILGMKPTHMHVDAVVALDGSGHYRTISEAIYAAPSYSSRRHIIYVKKGVYRENIDMKKKKINIMLVGDGIGATVVTGNRNFMQGWTTFRTATVAVSGKGFIARDMTFRNTAGPQKHQAVALRVDSDQSAFYRCSMEGHQDTLYAHSLRQFYRECNVYGTIDFIFGNGAAVLQNCKIYTRVPLPLQKVTITAQGRKNPSQSTGFSIQDSYVLASQPTYLGRPWKQYSRTVFMNTYMSGLVQPRGWLEWYGNFALGTLWYGEYRNYGPGASLSERVKWPGYHIIRDASTANFFTPRRFIDGMSWLPATGIKFTAGLDN